MNHNRMNRITCAACDSKLGWHDGMLPYVLCEDCYLDAVGRDEEQAIAKLRTSDGDSHG